MVNLVGESFGWRNSTGGLIEIRNFSNEIGGCEVMTETLSMVCPNCKTRHDKQAEKHCIPSMFDWCDKCDVDRPGFVRSIESRLGLQCKFEKSNKWQSTWWVVSPNGVELFRVSGHGDKLGGVGSLDVECLTSQDGQSRD